MVKADSFEAVADGPNRVSSMTIKLVWVRSGELKPALAEFTESVGQCRSDG